MAKLTKSFIDKVPIPEPKSNGKASQSIYRDETLAGYGLLVGSGGTKSFFIEKRVNGRVKRISIGRYGHLTPTQAKTKAHELLGDIALGNDPAAIRRAKKSKSVTLATAIEDYFQTRKNLKPRTVKNYRALFNGYIPEWFDKRLADISKDMIEERHSSIGKKAPVAANNLMRTLRAVFNHAIAKYENETGKPALEFNPVDRLSHNRAWYKVERRRGHLKPHELKPWFNATLELPTDVSRDYMHFLLFSGLRRTEAATLKWSHINLKDNSLTIVDTKNSEPHTLPLNTYLRAIIDRRKQAATNEWVFPSPTDDNHLRDPRRSIEYIQKSLDRNITFHDLRRTFITIAESLDIPAYALKRLLNHKNTNDVTEGYLIIDVERLRTPMQKIADFILLNVEE